MGDNILSDFGINLLEEEIDDVIFQTNEFLCDATFTGSQGPFWWILQMCMALAALFSLIVAGQMAFKMMYKNEPLDVMKLLRPLGISLIMCWWYPPADSGTNSSGSSWCVLDFLSYIPNSIGSYTHELYSAEAAQIEDKFKEVQELVFVRDSLYTDLQAQADVARTGTSDPNLIESTMETTGVEEVTQMEKDASKLWFTSLTSGAVVCIDKIVMVIALIVFRIGWWATNQRSRDILLNINEINTAQNGVSNKIATKTSVFLNFSPLFVVSMTGSDFCFAKVTKISLHTVKVASESASFPEIQPPKIQPSKQCYKIVRVIKA